MIALKRVSSADRCLLLAYGGSRGNGEVYVLFMRLLPLDFSASVAVSAEILRHRVWRVQQPRSTAVHSLLQSCSHSLQDSMAHDSLT